ncbi:Manganese transport system membrane protein MntB [bacterium HR37]|nr:Manganese transport system membrane protein MntB [bacterium HR37]
MSVLFEYLVAPFHYEFMQRALLAAIMVGLICSILSCYLLVKRWALLGDAISHAVLPGVAFAYMIGTSFFLGAVITGVLTALGIGFVERNARIKEDAAIGIMFTGAFALGILLMSIIRSKSVDLYHILFGNVLGVSTGDLVITALTGVVVLLVVFLLFKELMLWSFDPTMASAIGLPVKLLHYLLMFLLSLTIVASLQTVGIVLVVAMLITPGATAFLLVKRLSTMMVLATLFGVFSAISGLYMSFYLNVASGPTMVLVSTCLFLMAMFVSPRRGIIPRWLKQRRAHLMATIEDYLKHAYHLQRERGVVSPSELSRRLGVSLSSALNVIAKLENMGLVERDKAGGLILTESGRERALKVIRSHRLWELFLTEEAGLGWDKVHDEAERLEHVISEDMTEQLEAILGEPRVDPHGHPIPTKEGVLSEPSGLSLAEAKPGSSGIVIWVNDDDPGVLKYLASIGMFPQKRVKVKGRSDVDRVFVIEIDENEYRIPYPVAKSVYIMPLLEEQGKRKYPG